MTGVDLVVVGACVGSAVVAGLLVRIAIPPRASLSRRTAPYLSPTLSGSESVSPGVFGQVIGPILKSVAEGLNQLVERLGSEMTSLRVRQAGWFLDIPEVDMLSAFRVAQLKSTTIGALVGFAVSRILDLRFAPALLLTLLGLTIGLTRQAGAVEKAIEARREVMRIEIYTVNQLLAMRVRAGGGVVQAVRATVERGQGEVVGELAEALRLHRAGWRASDAFRRIAELTPEPYCSRTYRLLAAAEERGSDLASALLALSEDVRETRRESIKRSATKRRAAMLVPTIAVLAPVLILFVAAPLPFLITGWR